MLGRAVRRGLKAPLMVGDMPMGSYEASNELAVANAQRLVKETGCQVVKLEAGGDLGRAGAGDHPLGHPGDGSRRPDPADRDRAGRLQDPGQDRAGGRSNSARTRWRCSRSAASRSSSRRSRRRSPRRSSGSSRCRRSGSAPARRPPGRCSSTTTCSGSRRAHGEIRQALRRDPRGDGRRRAPLRRGGALAAASPSAEHVYGVEPAELDELRRYLDQESLTSQKAWDWEPLP